MRLRRHGTLGTYLATAYALSFVALLGAMFAALHVATRVELDRRIDDDLVEGVGELARVWREGGDAAVAREIVRETAANGRRETFLMLLDGRGAPLAVSDLELWPGVAPRDAAVRSLQGERPRLSTERYAERGAPARTISAARSRACASSPGPRRSTTSRPVRGACFFQPVLSAR